MLIPEPTVIIATAALAIAVINSLFIWSLRRKLDSSMQDIRQEMRVNNSATYGLAHHLRRVQDRMDQTKDPVNGDDVSFSEADKLVDRGVDVLQLAEQLGVSQNEAEIITHLRPTRESQQTS